MKLALIIEHFDPHRGGAEAMTVWLAGELAARGHEVHVVCHDARPPNPRQAAHAGASYDAERSRNSLPAVAAAPDGVVIHRLRGGRLSTGFGFRHFGREAAAWCREHKPQVAHSMTIAWPGDVYHPHAGVYASIQRQSVAMRDTPAKAQLKKLLLKLTGKQRMLLKLERAAIESPARGGARHIICISGLMEQEFTQLYAVPPQRLIRLENPLMRPAPDATEMAEHRQWLREIYGYQPDDRVALFAGHDFRRKGLAWAIRAIGATQSQWKLLVVGLGRVRRFLELAQQLGVAERVKFIGPTEHMNRMFAGSDALLLPTFYESFGLVALESLAHGRPVISTNYLGCGELVRSSGAGTIVPTPRNVAEMALALDALPTSGPELARMQAAAMRAAANSQPGPYLDKLEAIYQRVARQ